MNALCFDESISFKSSEQIMVLQQQLLKEHLQFALENSPYYQERLAHFSGLDTVEIAELPFTDKSELSKHNLDFLSVEKKRVADIVFSSGTTGVPTQIMYTANDLERLAYNEKSSFQGCGISDDNVILLTCTMDRCFIAGLAYFLGGSATGAAMIRNGHGTLESHYDVIRRTSPSVIIGVPSFLRKLASYVLNRGLDPESLPIKKIICIGEPLRDRNMRPLKQTEELEKLWGAKAYSTYASSEMVTTFCECTEQHGGHLHPDLGIVEIVNEEGEILNSGEVGEIVVTPLQVEGMPLIRYRTGDISFLMNEPCGCGRNTARLGPIIGRKKQLLKIKGTSLYPQAVFAVLDEISSVREYYLVIKQAADLSDLLEIHVAVTDSETNKESLLRELQARLRVAPQIVFDLVEDIRQIVYTKESRKPIRVIDERG